MIAQLIRKYIGGLRFLSVFIMTPIFIFLVPKDQVTWGIFTTYITAWAGLEAYKKTIGE